MADFKRGVLRTFRVHDCQRCGKRYRTKGPLVRHQNFECGVPPQFPCHLCPYRSRRNDELKNHLFRIHKVISVNAGRRSRNFATETVVIKAQVDN